MTAFVAFSYSPKLTFLYVIIILLLEKGGIILSIATYIGLNFEVGSFLPVFFIVGIIKLKNRIVIVTNAIFT